MAKWPSKKDIFTFEVCLILTDNYVLESTLSSKQEASIPFAIAIFACIFYSKVFVYVDTVLHWQCTII